MNDLASMNFIAVRCFISVVLCHCVYRLHNSSDYSTFAFLSNASLYRLQSCFVFASLARRASMHVAGIFQHIPPAILRYRAENYIFHVTRIDSQMSGYSRKYATNAIM